MRFKIVSLLLVLGLSVFLPLNIQATTKTTNLYFFHAQGCLTCAAESEFLSTLLEKDPNLKLYSYELAFDQDNQEFAKKISELLPNPINSTPTLVIGQKVIVGFVSGTTDLEIQESIDYAQNNVIKDVIGEVLGIAEVTNGTSQTTSQVNLPFFGKVEAKSISLPLLAIVLGTLDGFNPCAMWVLLLLISMLFHLEEQWKKWFLGSIFLLTTAIMYLMFMVSWLNITLLFGTISTLRWLIGALAIGGGGFNLYRYFTTEPGCEVIDDRKRKKISVRIRQIFSQPVFVLASLGVMALAISVNLVELICSAGLPVLFTQVLSLNQLSGFEYGVYMLLYLAMFIADDVIIFALAMKTSQVSGISTKYARTAHLVGGILMILLGILMVIKPEWLMLNFG